MFRVEKDTDYSMNLENQVSNLFPPTRRHKERSSSRRLSTGEACDGIIRNKQRKVESATGRREVMVSFGARMTGGEGDSLLARAWLHCHWFLWAQMSPRSYHRRAVSRYRTESYQESDGNRGAPAKIRLSMPSPYSFGHLYSSFPFYLLSDEARASIQEE